MSSTNPMSMGAEVRVNVAATSARNVKVVWTRDMEKKVLDLLLEQIQLGRKGDGGFKKEAWITIAKKFNEDMNMNLVKDNFKNKLKMWKQGFRIMKELRNMSGFAWNETTQCVNADDSVWDELLKRSCFKNVRVYKRQPFFYFNELAIIFGNDIAEGNATATATKIEDGHLFEESVDLDDDGGGFNTPIDEGFNTPMDGGFNTSGFDDDVNHSNNSTTSVRKNPSTPTTRREKRRKQSMTTSLDVICESIQNIDRNMAVEKKEKKQDIANAYAALKAMPTLSQETLIVAYDYFTSEPTKA